MSDAEILHTPPEWPQPDMPLKVRLLELPQIRDVDWERMARERDGAT